MVSHCQLAKNAPLARLGSQNMPAHRQRRTLSTGNWFTQHGFPLSAYRELLGEIAKHAHACFHLRHLPHLFPHLHVEALLGLRLCFRSRLLRARRTRRSGFGAALPELLTRF